MAITIIPLIGSVGAAVDYRRANAAHTALLAALDSTALLLSKTAAQQTPTELQTAATNAFNAMFHQSDVTNVALTASYSSVAGSKATLTGTATVPTDFLNVLGFSAITISATTTTIWGNTRLRVGLVLDSIGSIASSSKMDTLKTTSHNLPDRLKSAAIDPEDVYASVIPKDVNIGASNYCETTVFNQTGTALSQLRIAQQCVPRGQKQKPGQPSRASPSLDAYVRLHDSHATQPKLRNDGLLRLRH